MKKIIIQITLFAIILLLYNSVIYAQKLPFQGKLLENGQPVNGQKTFAFTINSGSINWTETHTNVTVTNGLYSVVLGSVSPLPTNLFFTQTSHQLQITVNGFPLTSVEIFPPIESDPTVPQNIKDGVGWNEISGIPPDIMNDNDPTNELQTLSLTGSTLSISNGNSVQIATSDSLLLTQNFQVGVYDTVNVLDVEQSVGGTYSFISSVWQSFTANHTGFLTDIWSKFANSLSSDIKLRVYVGEGNSGQAIYDHTYPAAGFPTGLQYQHFSIYNPEMVSLNKNSKYTFEIIGISNSLTFEYSGGNIYIQGTSSLGVNNDLTFKVFINNFLYPSLIVPEQGQVMSIVNGTEYYMVPKGAIIMWSGTINNLPDGWALCNGTNGTPDLRDRFIVGAGSTYNISASGGEATHALTTEELPSHYHLTFYDGTTNATMTASNFPARVYTVSGDPYTDVRGQTNTANVGKTTTVGNGSAHNNLPPYFALAFIMKI